MTMEEITKKMSTEFGDEMEDSKMYFEMAKAAEHMNNMELASGFYEISKEEYTHARFIREMLIDHGVTIPEAHKAMWEETEERMMRYFR